MFYSINELTTYLFLDAEAIPQYKSLDDAPAKFKDLWLKKHHCKYLEKEIQARKEKIFLEKINEFSSSVKTSNLFNEIEIKDNISIDEIYIQYSPLQPEFSRLLCIALGVIDKDRNIENVVLYEEDEKELLSQISHYFNEQGNMNLAGYHIKGYDIPFLIKRMLSQNVPLPKQLQMRGKKPWEVYMLDLAEDWKGLNFTMVSLDAVCMSLGLDSPKDEFDGGEMSHLYMSGQIDIEQVKKYNYKDNIANMQIALKLCK